MRIQDIPAEAVVFATAPLMWADWLRVALFAGSFLLVEEARKMIIRHGAWRRHGGR